MRIYFNLIKDDRYEGGGAIKWTIVKEELMPEWRSFQDAMALRGRPKKAAVAETEIHANSLSRSLNASSHDAGLSRMLHLEIRPDHYLHLDFSKIINDGRIKVSRKAAMKLANWILESYRSKDADDSPKADVVRKSKSHGRISPKPDEAQP